MVPILQRPMIEWVYNAAQKARIVDGVWVATDDKRIARAVEEFGGQVVMTSSSHPTGTHRVMEAARAIRAQRVVNLQGDEPLIRPEQIDLVVEMLEGSPEADIATLCYWSSDPEELGDPNSVKVVMDHQGWAMYFSRARIPFPRDMGQGDSLEGAWVHVGLYAYSQRAIEVIPLLPPCPWEQIEKLEQLRFLYWGLKIKVAPTTHRTIGVDVPEDVERVEKILREIILREHFGGEI